ncbi:MerR family transcriptional regulator [Acutalibacter caecimuris]|uniref:MerR family transcriptional regulator n=1 Tax=Acutalibacter caecimuris TaxID=3093657 RepID=UPI002AC9C438|nr:MerR family transcriptional regulator [Acutalibacter sp. M00118]
MTIKEVSEKYGITQDTLRYYERVGMIPHVTRAPSGHRDYQPEDIAWVELAKCMRNAGLTVDAIVDYVRLFQAGDDTVAARLELLRSQRASLLAQSRQIQEALSRLDKKIEGYENLLK